MPNLSASALIGVLLHNQNLTYICLEKSYNAVTDEILKIIASVCRKVKTLSLSYCSLVTDTGIGYLSEYCHLLGELSLAHCYDVSALALCELIRNSPRLTVVSLECIALFSHFFPFLLSSHSLLRVL